MSGNLAPAVADAAVHPDRRTRVLQAALLTFARFGYRGTSMEQVARDAGISRPGLYFLFSSKPALFREAVERSLGEDLGAAERALTDSSESLEHRMLEAFDHWAGRYIGPLTRDITAVVEDNPDVLGPVATAAPQQFARLIISAISASEGEEFAEPVAQTLISTSIGIKHQVDDRATYLRRLAVAIDLLLAGVRVRSMTVQCDG